MRNNLTARELAATVHSHPTLSEAIMEAAHDVHGEAIHSPPKKKA
jgi:dihydrolipoamide dehydrogenase